jgi:hypothetical protein
MEDSNQNPRLRQAREEFHRDICCDILGRRSGGYLSNADSGSTTSKGIAEGIAERLGLPLCQDLPSPQTAGNLFEGHVRDYLQDTFDALTHIRPGNWIYETKKGIAISEFDQYEHLDSIVQALEDNEELKASLGQDYLVSPDVVVGRQPVDDNGINEEEKIVEPGSQDEAGKTPLRELNNPGRPILHATISCKWTIRSGRSQNSRTEALNIIRNRKGNTPHIAVVTAEPMPTRLSSIAMGTGDIDCTYHIAFPELIDTLEEMGNEDQLDMIRLLVRGRRLRDISDLPLDLAT